MNPIILVFFGGGTGAVARYLFGSAFGRLTAHAWPWAATWAINVLGSLAMGVLIGALALKGGGDQERWRLLLGVGVLGGFTTFSAFSLDAVLLLQKKAYGIAALYVAGSVGLSLAGVVLGLALARRWLG